MKAADLLARARFDLDHDGTSIRGALLADLTAAGLPEAVRIDAVRRWLRSEVDAEAERRRNAVMTPGVGQAMEYQEAQSQAAAALKASASATPEKYPMLAASIGVDVDPSTGTLATDVVGVARSIDQARTLWLVIGSAIRGARLAAKKAIDEAATIEAATAAFDAVAWPAPPTA